MNMTPKSMSDNESSGDRQDIVMNLNSTSGERNANSAQAKNNHFKIKLDEVGEQSKILPLILPFSQEKYHCA